MALIPLFFKDSRFKVVVQQAHRLSDAVLSLPVIAALKQNYKYVQVVVICAPESAELFSGHSDVDAVIVAQRQEFGLISNLESIEAQLRDENADVYLELWANLKLAVVARKCGIRIRIGDTTPFMPVHFFTHGVKSGREILTRHESEIGLKILDRLNSISRLPEFTNPVQSSFKQAADELLSRIRQSGKPVVGIDVSTDNSGVKIPPATIRKTAHLLSSSAHVILLGGPENPLVFSDLTSDSLSILFDAPLPLLLAVISQLDAFAGTTSGISQMASYTQRPTVMFIPRKADFPTRIGPVSPVFKILRNDTMCAHSAKQMCAPERCWQWFTPELLTDSILSLIDRKNSTQKWDLKAIKKQHLKASIRALWVVQTPDDYFKAVAIKAELEPVGVLVFPTIVRADGWASILDLIHLCEQYNISVIHGKLNPAVGSIIRGAMGTIRQYVMPQFLNENPLRQRRNGDGLIKLYHQIWDPAATG